MITLKKKFYDSFNFLYNKKALVRVDLNVPMKNGEVDDNTRLSRIIPTLKTLYEKKAKVILISHFGRPNGDWNIEYSMKDICNELSILLKDEIKFVDKNINNINNADLEVLFKDYNFLLLENLRFYP
jgi:phosphoglycerate kinase